MPNALIIHGICDKNEFFGDFPSGSNSHWLPWLQKELIKKGVETQTPEMPTPYDPRYDDWKRVFGQFHVGPETMLVGHSAGAGFLLRWLGENQTSFQKLILVAPWLDPSRGKKGFLDFAIDPLIQGGVGEIHIFASADDPVEGVRESVEKIMETLPKAKIHTLWRMRHFTFEEMGTSRFPSLLETMVK
nr:alpha/beta hydrolase family [uncultured bacterium]